MWHGIFGFNGVLLIQNSEGKPTGMDVVCLFRNAKYSEGKSGEESIQCLTCETWVHRKCVGYVCGSYACDYRK